MGANRVRLFWYIICPAGRWRASAPTQQPSAKGGPAMATINDSVQYLKGVGPAFAKKFEKLGIHTIRDLLLCYPRKYIDYTQPYTVVSAPYDTDCCVRATVLQKEPPRRITGGRVMSRVLAADDSGILSLTWFNAAYAADNLTVGENYYFEGRIGGALTRRELLHPLVRTEAQVAACPFVAVYPGTEGLPASRHAACAHAALAYADELTDPLPPALLTRYRMPAKAQAVRAIHAPQNAADLAAARRRLIFEELYLLQIGIFLLRSHGRNRTSAPMHPLDLGPFWRSLPYPPTGAQRRSTEEIVGDLCGDVPMNRLLQGDVGSGKTLVAAAAIWFAAQNGWQSALLAPTEILARQHAATLADRLEPFGVNVTLLVGGMKAKERRIALSAIADGRAGLVVGTHAVLTDTVEFKNLGLAIVDEQHRFGVRQRGLLAGKAQSPHLLVMSATPIPRTLGLLMYGDLDISVLDELPPGRKPVKTWFITGKKRRDMYGFLDKQIEAGHQVYIVCPAIEENEASGGLQAVTTYYTQTACALLPRRRIGLLHGKLKPKEKDEVMQKFKAGELDVLVSTTVIEVGVDVPNATVMVIENAERFGLSALHQLRGRVGRGAADSCCILISDNVNEPVRERLQFLCRTPDGFAVAKYDLETRGPGDFFGAAQHGLPTLRVADLVQDTKTLRVAQDEAKALLAIDPNLIDPAHRALSDEVERLFETAGAMN
ncbi:ATP-dependent DNA helicase RecG [uncultured Gemmiger sp.]|uniref:ATP-dependent DNA helicase RecG n=1 Tax=uncultured Gemmiger sp. TaxID=1623490 RepID=UPI0025CF7679|nr:ATP-dependent DNA helicase RecG [uncultured Gemmiger sp.]